MSRKASSPVPSGMAAVMAVIEGSFSASVSRALEKACVNVIQLALPSESPVSTSKMPIPWNLVGFSSAGLYPFPFLVTT